MPRMPLSDWLYHYINISTLTSDWLSFRFYFPNGNPSGKISVDGVCKKFSEAFSKNKHSSVTTEQLGHVLKVRY